MEHLQRLREKIKAIDTHNQFANYIKTNGKFLSKNENPPLCGNCKQARLNGFLITKKSAGDTWQDFYCVGCLKYREYPA